MSELESKVKRYVKTFGEGIPVFQLPDMSAEELIALIDEHIKAGKPIRAEASDDPDILY